MQRVLIIRFSSLGDIAQALQCVDVIRRNWPTAEIHWLTRSDFSDLVGCHPAINTVWSLDKKKGLKGLFEMLATLRAHRMTHVYDAHSNLRSLICRIYFYILGARVIRRPKDRLRRILLFYFRLNFFEKPFRGAVSFIRPLKRWMNIDHREVVPQLHFPNFESNFDRARLSESVALAPSAAWELKRWPIEHWQTLVKNASEMNFVLLGGPQDEFCKAIEDVAPERVVNLAGQLSWTQTAHVVSLTKAVVSGDTGVLHLSDLQGRPTVAIIGPTAFGYPTRESSRIVQMRLPCQPCTKDGNTKCRNVQRQQCLRDLNPATVLTTLRPLVIG